MLELLNRIAKLFGLVVVDSSIPSLLVLCLPVGALETLVLTFNVVPLTLDLLKLVVWNVDSILGLMSVVLDGHGELSPFFHHSLSFW